MSLFNRRRLAHSAGTEAEAHAHLARPLEGGSVEPSHHPFPRLDLEAEAALPVLDEDSPPGAIREFGSHVVRDLFAIRKELESVADRSENGAERLEAKVTRLQQSVEAAEMMLQVLSKRSMDRREQFNDVWLLIKDLDVALDSVKQRINEHGERHDTTLDKMSTIESKTSMLATAIGSLVEQQDETRRDLSDRLGTLVEGQGKLLRQLDRELDLLEESFNDRLTERDRAAGVFAEQVQASIHETNATISDVLTAMNDTQTRQAERQTSAIEAIVESLTAQDAQLRETRSLGELLVTEVSELQGKVQDLDHGTSDRIQGLESGVNERLQGLESGVRNQILELERSFENTLAVQSMKDEQVRERLEAEHAALGRSVSALGAVIANQGDQLTQLQGDHDGLVQALRVTNKHQDAMADRLAGLDTRTSDLEGALGSIASTWDETIGRLEAKDQQLESQLKGGIAALDHKLSRSVEALSGALDQRLTDHSGRQGAALDKRFGDHATQQEAELRTISQSLDNRFSNLGKTVHDGIALMKETRTEQHERLVSLTATQQQLGDRLKRVEETGAAVTTRLDVQGASLTTLSEDVLRVGRTADALQTALPRLERLELESEDLTARVGALTTTSEISLGRLDATQAALASLSAEQQGLTDRIELAEQTEKAHGEAIARLDKTAETQAHLMGKSHHALRSELAHLAEKAQTLTQQGETLKNLLHLSREAMAQDLQAAMVDLQTQFRATREMSEELLDRTETALGTLDERITSAVADALLMHRADIEEHNEAFAKSVVDALEAKVTRALGHQHGVLGKTLQEVATLKAKLADRELESMVLRESLSEVQARLQHVARGMEGDARAKRDPQQMANRVNGLVGMLGRAPAPRTMGA